MLQQLVLLFVGICKLLIEIAHDTVDGVGAWQAITKQDLGLKTKRFAS